MARKKNTPSLTLPPALTVDAAGDLHRQLVEVLAGKPKAVDVDLAAVTRCDTAGLQLLCTARRTAAGLGSQWRLFNAPETVLRACSEVGIQPEEIGI